MTCMGVTHHEFDFDGGSCMRFMERQGIINGCIFGDEELKNGLAENRITKLIFADASPKESIPSGIEVLIYDHHMAQNEASISGYNKTAFDIMLEAIGTCGMDQDKITRWRKLVQLGDQKAEADDMDIMRALKRVHSFFESNRKTYEKWFIPLFDSFFSNESNIDHAIELLRNSISKFFSNNPDSPAGQFLKRWMKRIQNKEKITRSTQRNLVHFLAYMEESVAREWIEIFLKAYHREQTIFQEAKKDFKKARLDFFGETLVISAITINPKFVQIARYMIFSKDEDISPFIREKITDRNSLWTVLLVNPKTKNFQIFINGNRLQSQEIITELVKAIRAEILKKRDRSVPEYDRLSEGGIIEGTEPLYFHKLETGYSSILWGSLKHPSEIQAVEFGTTSAAIYSRLVEIIKLALDKDEYAVDCNPSACQNCSIYPWQIKKCWRKRKGTEEYA